jgi:hypothetical protein
MVAQIKKVFGALNLLLFGQRCGDEWDEVGHGDSLLVGDKKMVLLFAGYCKEQVSLRLQGLFATFFHPDCPENP